MSVPARLGRSVANWRVSEISTIATYLGVNSLAMGRLLCGGERRVEESSGLRLEKITSTRAEQRDWFQRTV
ncbi:hypothetical protein PC119_g25937 [Phytophthora cactorum]|nr:hypothetical protein PC119_g25937 [Phytophthora cactorum]